MSIAINKLEIPPVTSGSADSNFNSDSLFDDNGIQKHKTPFIQYKTYELPTTNDNEFNVEQINFQAPSTFYTTPDHHYIKLHITAFRFTSIPETATKVIVFGTRGRINTNDNSFEGFRPINNNTSANLLWTTFGPLQGVSERPFVATQPPQINSGQVSVQFKIFFYSSLSYPTTVKIISYIA